MADTSPMKVAKALKDLDEELVDLADAILSRMAYWYLRPPPRDEYEKFVWFHERKLLQQAIDVLKILEDVKRCKNKNKTKKVMRARTTLILFALCLKKQLLA